MTVNRLKRMRISQRRFTFVVIMSVLAIAGAPSANAQNLGPFRQFLALEGAYDRIQLDAGSGRDRIGLNGYGGRLWIELAPFVGPGSIGDHAALALTYFTTPRGDRGIFTRNYGAELDLYPLSIPIGNLLDPFVSLGGSRFQLDNGQPAGAVGSADLARGRSSNFALTPGVGIRVPIPNRFQLRLDAKDLIVFSRKDLSGARRTSHSPEFMAGLGLTF